MPLPRPLADLLCLPTAAYRESAILSYIERACRALAGVKTRYDRYGNLLAHYRHVPRTATPLAFVAHTDHPGFVAAEMLDRRTLRAHFRGGVKPEYFPKAKVRFSSEGGWVNARVLELTKVTPVAVPGWTGRPEEALLRVSGGVEPNAPGMWDLPDPVLHGDQVIARACDDVAGAGALLALLQRLSRKRARGEVYCLFTRAEEVGFMGAIAAARVHTIPKRLPVISIETSSALPNAPIGGGPILRVGDRLAVFTPELTAFCVRVAQALTQRRKSFVFQRKLMDGGVCEAYAFIAYGYAATGICVALGNYHNMDTRRVRIGSEYVSLRDWLGMVDLFEALVREETDWRRGDPSARANLDQRFEQGEPLLLA
jgi:putative aminopeptidase FrvX